MVVRINGDENYISSNRGIKMLVSSILILVITVILLLVTIYLLLWLFTDLSVSNIFEFFIVCLNLITTCVLSVISWRLFNIEQNRDVTHADIEQKGEWRSIVNQLRERVVLVNKVIVQVHFHSHSSIITTYVIRNIAIYYLLIALDLRQLENRKPKEGKETISARIRDDSKDEIRELPKERIDIAKRARNILEKILADLERDRIRQAEKKFKTFSNEHYELTIRALRHYDPYNL